MNANGDVLLIFRTLTVLLCISFSSPPSLATSAAFSPNSCDFSVVFPQGFKLKEMTKGGVKAFGAASGRGDGNTRFGAECWPSDKQVRIETVAKNLEKSAIQRNIDIMSVIIEKNTKLGEQAILSGILMIDDKRVFVKFISIAGPRSRLDLSIVDSELLSQRHIDFRNSVERKLN